MIKIDPEIAETPFFAYPENKPYLRILSDDYVNTSSQLNLLSKDIFVQQQFLKHWPKLSQLLAGLWTCSAWELSTNMVNWTLVCKTENIQDRLNILFRSIHYGTAKRNVHIGWLFGHALEEMTYRDNIINNDDKNEYRKMCIHIQKKYPLCATLFSIKRYIF